ncbi:sodium/proton antiporter (CPA1 family) [Blastomonas natatoria]|uniref:Sodium/proton antiporter (CPA1 family) n=1 Tax=Blastomonas natatoria TaxID=34015 RepID=A0A2V3V4Q9_9SPHN|nr:cation:proton antiporter [Blastomonas natatoria]PXW75205.1 sodium/proton antiporter (CPA1 family) [Blastomonas natatoria]
MHDIIRQVIIPKTPELDVTAFADPLFTSVIGQFLLTHYKLWLLAIGLVVLLVAWLPLLLKKLPLSLPIIFVGMGMAIFAYTPVGQFSPHPVESPVLIEKASEFIVIISLMGAGLKIGRPLSWRGWNLTIRLLAIVMPLTILFIVLSGMWILSLPLASALLLGACLAPTDPVLAADVQIERPDSDDSDEARFALTSEAGLNDALAFPFVYLALAASAAAVTGGMLAEWVWYDVIWRLGVGGLVGAFGGWLMGQIIYRLPQDTRLSRTGDGFIAVGATLAIYALTEFAHGYGFLAVFIAGLILRRSAEGDDFNSELHDFADETERLVMMVLLVLFGGMLTGGELLSDIGWTNVLVAALVLLVIRPVIGYLGLIGVDRPPLEKFVIAFFGIRGLGSVYYLAFGLNHGDFPMQHTLWETLGLIVLGSILLHGLTVTPIMQHLSRRIYNRTE